MSFFISGDPFFIICSVIIPQLQARAIPGRSTKRETPIARKPAMFHISRMLHMTMAASLLASTCLSAQDDVLGPGLDHRPSP